MRAGYGAHAREMRFGYAPGTVCVRVDGVGERNE